MMFLMKVGLRRGVIWVWGCVSESEVGHGPSRQNGGLKGDL